MKYLIAPVLALAALTGSATAENRNLNGFDAIEAQGRMRLEVTMGQSFSVDVTGPEADQVEARVDGHSLHIREHNRHLFGGDRRVNALVRVTLPRLTALSTARGTEARATDIRADDLALSVSMGSELDISGTCHDLSISGSMGADIDARSLDCANAEVSASMGASVRAHARDSANASASMGGDIDISGNPTRRSSSASMGGDISYD